MWGLPIEANQFIDVRLQIYSVYELNSRYLKITLRLKIQDQWIESFSDLFSLFIGFFFWGIWLAVWDKFHSILLQTYSIS